MPCNIISSKWSCWWSGGVLGWFSNAFSKFINLLPLHAKAQYVNRLIGKIFECWERTHPPDAFINMICSKEDKVFIHNNNQLVYIYIVAENNLPGLTTPTLHSIVRLFYSWQLNDILACTCDRCLLKYSFVIVYVWDFLLFYSPPSDLRKHHWLFILTCFFSAFPSCKSHWEVNCYVHGTDSLCTIFHFDC